MRCIGSWTGTPKEYPWGMVLGTGWMIRCFCFLPLPLHAKTQSYPTSWTPLFIFLKEKTHGSRGNIPIFRKSLHTMFSSYSRPGFWCVTLIGISAQSGGNSWAMANPLNAPPQLSIPYVVPKQLWTLDELKAALIREFPHLSTEEGQGCQR